VVSLRIDIDTSGPVFDGRAAAAARDMADAIKWVVGTKALAQVQQNLDTSLRNPTPYYETQVTVDRRADDVVVHDRGIIYGPWLEGVGSRNRTTRFKGYFSFRRARQEIEGRVPQIIARTVARHVRRMQ
jgi:hypothetical protein